MSPGPATARLLAVGDVAVDDSLLEVWRRRGAAEITRGLDGLGTFDLKMANLESVLTRILDRNGTTGGFLKADPDAAELLHQAGLAAVTVANNHCLDYGSAGLIESLDALQAAGIASSGAGRTLAEARRPAIVTAEGLRIGILGYCDDFRADPEHLRRATPAPAFDEWILEDLRLLRPAVDVVVLQLHWGYEFQLYPLQHLRDRARAYAEAGADVVLCHHAHVVMGVERWGRSVIAHGLGNSIFPDDDYFREGNPLSAFGAALEVGISAEGVVFAAVHPTALSLGGGLRLVRGGARRMMMGILRETSEGLDNDRWLSALTAARLTREAHALMMATDERRSDSAVREALHALAVPRQRELLGWLDSYPDDDVVAWAAALAEAGRTASMGGDARLAMARARSLAGRGSFARFANHAAGGDLPGLTP